jgi:hypothetical protein
MSLQPAPQQPQDFNIEGKFAAKLEVTNTRWWLAFGLYWKAGDQLGKFGLFLGDYQPYLRKELQLPAEKHEP